MGIIFAWKILEKVGKNKHSHWRVWKDYQRKICTPCAHVSKKHDLLFKKLANLSIIFYKDEADLFLKN